MDLASAITLIRGGGALEIMIAHRLLKAQNMKTRVKERSKDQPEEFLADLCDIVAEGRLDSEQVLRSLRGIFEDKALLWYKSERRNNSMTGSRQRRTAYAFTCKAKAPKDVHTMSMLH